MNITGVNATAGVGHSGGTIGNSQQNSMVDALQRQKMELQNQLKEVNASKLDSKTKADKIKEINQEIATLDGQIQQARVQEQQDKLQENMSKGAQRQAEQQKEQGDNGAVAVAASLTQMIYAGAQQSSLHALGKIRSDLQGKINIANGEIKNSVVGASTTYQVSQIADAAGKLAGVEQRMATCMKDIKKVDEAVQKGRDKAQQKENSTLDNKEEQENLEGTDDKGSNKQKEEYKTIDIIA